MATKDENGNWIDAAGKTVPQKYIDSHTKARDKLVEALVGAAQTERKRLEKFGADANAKIQKFLEQLFSQEGFTPNKKGNYTLTNFSGDQQVCVKVHEFMEFDERITLAKRLIDECIEDWSEGADANLLALVNEAFRVRGKKGLDVKSVLGLKKIQVKDKSGRWAKAMKLIDESLRTVASKSYLQFKVRPDPSAEWKTIRLDLADVALGAG